MILIVGNKLLHWFGLMGEEIGVPITVGWCTHEANKSNRLDRATGGDDFFESV